MMNSLLLYITLLITPLTLDSALESAKLNNADLRSARLDVAISQEVKKQVLWKYFPQVNITGFAFYAVDPMIDIYIPDLASSKDGQEVLKALLDAWKSENPDASDHINLLHWGGSAKASAIQPVYWGGQIYTGNKLAKLGIQASQEKLRMSERDILQEVEENYWLVAGLYDKRKTVQQVQTLLDTLSHIATIAYNSGLVTQTDLLQVELKRNEINTQALQLENGIRLAGRNLCHLIGVPYTEGLVLESFDKEDEIALIAQQDTFYVEGRPEARLLAMNVEAEKLQKRLSMGDALPKIGIGLQGGYSNFFDKDRWNAVGFAFVQIPLTQWGETSHKLKEHNLRIQQAEQMQADFLGKMRLQNEQAYDALTESIKLLIQHQSAIKMAQENYRLSLLNYKAGLCTISDLLMSQALLLQAQNAYTDTRILYRNTLRKYNHYNQQK